jgi:hypothetical protein
MPRSAVDLTTSGDGLMMTRMILVTAAWGTVMAAAEPAHAIPILQLYLEGGEYDQNTESWVLEASSQGDPFRIWAIGNVDGPGGKGTIYDVRLAIAYDESLGDIEIRLTPNVRRRAALSRETVAGHWTRPVSATSPRLLMPSRPGLREAVRSRRGRSES